jgi:hypothetical protein
LFNKILEKIKMEILKSKTLAIMIALILMISMGASMMLVPSISAHSPPWQIPTFAYVNVFPNPIGVGQTATIYMFLGNLPQAGAGLQNDYRFHNYILTITAPNGSIQTQNFSYISDPTGNQHYELTPTQIGAYQINFTFAGFAINDVDHLSTSALVNDTYLPSSNNCTLTVQQSPIPTSPVNPPLLPSDFWTRPIYGENTNWYSISSNWLGTGSAVSSKVGSGTISGFGSGVMERYPGDAIGPLTSHVMWTYPIEPGGVVGGNQSVVIGNSYFEGSAYANRFINPIIMDGVLYYTEPLSLINTPGALIGGTSYGPTVAQNLLTGQIIWSRTDVPALSFGYIYDIQNPDQHGTYPPILFTSNFGEAFDAYTGNWLFNVTGVPSGTAAQGPQGEQLRYVIANAGTATNPDWRLGEWNSSKLWTYNLVVGTNLSPTISNSPSLNNGFASGPVDASISTNQTSTVSLVGGSQTLSLNRYDWNVSLPWMGSSSLALAQVYAFYNNMLILRNGSMPSLIGGTTFGATGGIFTPYEYIAVNLNPSKGPIGSVLWTNTVQPPPNNSTVVNGPADPTVGAFTEYYENSIQWVGYSMTTGKQIWGPTAPQTPFDYFGNPVLPYISGQAAYGNLYSVAYGGILYCYSLTNGSLLYTYGNGGPGNSTNSDFQTIGHYPTFIQAVGNGIIYLTTTEHTVETPILLGATATAINASTGQEIWSLSDYTGEFNSISYAIADGYSTFFNGYDDQIYSVGQGSSAITVSAPDVATSFGTPVIIKGTVMDVSSGTKQTEQAADFPNGVPVASDASMTAWMGYVYQQQSMPTNFIGVPVTVDVLDSNGNYRNIGTATTTLSGTYSLAWTPDIPGNYTVIATFHGNNGYWGSYAQTAFDVMQAPAATATPMPAPASITDTYVLGSAIAIIIAIAIVGAVLLLTLRKRP